MKEALDEYDAAQERGEVRKNGGDRSRIPDENSASVEDIGLTHKQIYEARKIRDAEERKILCPFDKRECLSLAQAAKVAGKSESTLRNWCEGRGLGRRVGGGNWLVSKVALAMFLDGDLRALRAYHAGDRSSPAVRSYFDRMVL